MSYTREQAEEMIKDWNVYQDYENKLYTVDIYFLNHKFGEQFEVGKWYKYDNLDSKICYQGNGDGFGTWQGYWGRSWGINSNNWQPMTDQEVHDFLKSECEKRYKVGDVVRSVMSEETFTIKSFSFTHDDEHLYVNHMTIFDLSTGEWAKVIKRDPIAEQIEKLEKELETLKSKYNEQNK